MSEPSLLERLRGVDTSTLSDADKSIPLPDPGIRSIHDEVRLVGRAFTVTAHDNLLSVVEGLIRAEPGDVLVIETGGTSRALMGEIFATEAIRRGLAGFVIDGVCRDLATLRAMPLPVFARGAVPNAAPAQAEPKVGLPVNIGGVEVNTGDWVVGDLDGLVIAPEERLAAAVAVAEGIKEREGALMAWMQHGGSLLDGLTYEEHLAKLRAGEESSLSFREDPSEPRASV
jgi:4-hydroxy-4-methyl-2-oxoglutarate aldolase